MFDHYYERYEPSDEELREIEELLNRNDEIAEHYEEEVKPKNRIMYTYDDEDIWRGWLHIHGIKW